ncbi:hypothetical protein TNCV_2618951 [Trichonephila clavipes]|uniref:Uncharacterized protein n=1 Tax=Trichonephila clavipes TaxID=2585209 RepID=A0A8X6WII2_TRICX|nr:hypothetical protein TNCV_2618951 [Trichonephila clavipes]
MADLLPRNRVVQKQPLSEETPAKSFSSERSPSSWSLDIIGHWNAKRSSVPYLTYWALDVGWPAFEIVFPYWWTWKETVGGANW